MTTPVNPESWKVRGQPLIPLADLHCCLKLGRKDSCHRTPGRARELNALVYQPLSFQAVKESIELG